jgi:hypothetical protein
LRRTLYPSLETIPASGATFIDQPTVYLAYPKKPERLLGNVLQNGSLYMLWLAVSGRDFKFQGFGLRHL